MISASNGSCEGELQPRDGAVIDGVGYLHGHMYPSPSLAGHLIVVGHHHPACLPQGRSRVCPPGTGIYPGRAGYGSPGNGRRHLHATRRPGSCSCRRSTRSPGTISSGSRKTRSHRSRGTWTQNDAEIILADGTYIGPLTSLVAR